MQLRSSSIFSLVCMWPVLTDCCTAQTADNRYACMQKCVALACHRATGGCRCHCMQLTNLLGWRLSIKWHTPAPSASKPPSSCPFWRRSREVSSQRRSQRLSFLCPSETICEDGSSQIASQRPLLKTRMDKHSHAQICVVT